MNSLLNVVLFIVFPAIFVSLLIVLMVFFIIYRSLTRSSLLSLLLHAAPSSVPPPTSVRSLDGFSAQVSWSPPTGDIRGLIDSYELKAYVRDHPESPPVAAVYLANGNFSGRVFPPNLGVCVSNWKGRKRWKTMSWAANEQVCGRCHIWQQSNAGKGKLWFMGHMWPVKLSNLADRTLRNDISSKKVMKYLYFISYLISK